MSATGLLLRVVARLVGPRLAVGLLPGWVAVVLAVVQLEPVLDLTSLQRWIAERGLVGDLWVVGVSALLGPALSWAGWRMAVTERSLLGLRRQPLDDRAWLGALGPWAVLACVPGALPAVLWGGVEGAVAAPALVGAGAVTLLAAGGRPWLGVALGGALFLLVALAHALAWPIMVLVAAAVLALMTPAVGVWRSPKSPPRRSWWRLPGRARTPMEAVARRDMLALSRCVPRLWSTVLVPAPLLAGAVWLSLERGVAEGHTGAIGAGMALCLASVLGAWALMQLVTLLGPQFDERRAPLSPLERVFSLSVTLETVLSPITTGVFLACWRLDGSEIMWLGLVAMTLSAGSQALSCRFAETRTPGAILSWQLWWALAVFAVLWIPWWTAVAVYAGMTLVAWFWAVRALKLKRRLHVAAG